MPVRKRKEIQEVLRGISSGDLKYQAQRTVKLAGIQFSATAGREKNILRAMEFAHTAIEKHADIICFSELFTLPWIQHESEDYSDLAEPVPGPSTIPFIELAARSGTVIVCSIAERADNGVYNTAVVIGPDGVIGTYRKLHLPNVPYWEEKRLFLPGNMGLPVFQTPHARIGILLCWDNFYPEAARILARKGAEIILAPTAAAFDSQFRWQAVISANAIVNNLFAMRVNRVGQEGDLHFYGKSFCVGPFGEMLVEPTFHRDAVFIAAIDLQAVEFARTEFPFLGTCCVEAYE